ncbi:MAG: DUF3800 domain-containing protein [Candidatus Kapaibacteriota bacterium]
MYVDESGDAGDWINPHSGNSRHYILSGLIVPSSDWNQSFARMKTLRKVFRSAYNFPMQEEVHASELIRVGKSKSYRSISKTNRMKILVRFIQEIPQIFTTGKIINIILDKTDFVSGTNYKEIAWSRLLQRYDTFLKKSGSVNGMVIVDGDEEAKIRALLRKMRIYNPAPSKLNAGIYQTPIDNIIEDIFERNSKHSFFIQAADIIAHSLYRYEYPKGSLKKWGIDRAFLALEPLLLKEVSGGDSLGVVREEQLDQSDKKIPRFQTEDFSRPE